MKLNFLPIELRRALDNLNYNYLSEIRLRVGQKIVVEYKGAYTYLGTFGVTQNSKLALVCHDVACILSEAMEKSVYAYTEQLKNAYITVDGGIRIGIGGEYVTDGGRIKTVQKPTSLNIRIPHDARGCARHIYEILQAQNFKSTLIFSPAGYGKTTILRDIARLSGKNLWDNVLVYDERYELSAIVGNSIEFDLGENCDIVRGADKLCGFKNAIRVMKPNIIVCDELYGDNDFSAVCFAIDCKIKVFASTHVSDRSKLTALPFDSYVELTGICKQAVIYDKNFDIVGNCDTFGIAGNYSD